MKTTRIDQYICLDIDQIIIDEMNEILSQDLDRLHMQEDKDFWTEAQAAAKVILGCYEV